MEERINAQPDHRYGRILLNFEREAKAWLNYFNNFDRSVNSQNSDGERAEGQIPADFGLSDEYIEDWTNDLEDPGRIPSIRDHQDVTIRRQSDNQQWFNSDGVQSWKQGEC